MWWWDNKKHLTRSCTNKLEEAGCETKINSALLNRTEWLMQIKNDSISYNLLLPLLLLLRSQLSLWVHHFGEIFALCDWVCCCCCCFICLFFFFNNPTIELITFRLRGWCVLGVFLLPAFTYLEHDCQDLLSPCDGMHVCTENTSVYTLILLLLLLRSRPC